MAGAVTSRTQWLAIAVLALSWFCVAAACFVDAIALAETRPQSGTNEWKLSAHARGFVGSAFYLGWFVGDMGFGVAASHWGRMPAIYVGAVVGAIGGLAATVASDWKELLLARALAGLGLGGVDLLAFVIGCEAVTTASSRSRFGALMQASFAVGIVAVGAIGTVVDEWRLCYLWLSLPSVLLLPLLPLAGQAAKRPSVIKIDQDEPLMTRVDEQANTPWSVELIRLMALMSALWGLVGFAYFGLTLSAGGLSRHLCVNLMLLGLIEIPAYLVNMILLEVLPRRSAAMLVVALQIVCNLTNLAVSLSAHELLIRRCTVPLAMCSKGLCSISFGCIWVWAPELYPTRLRTIGVAFNSQCARAASMAAPIVLAHLQSAQGGWSSNAQVMLLLTTSSILSFPVVYALPNLAADNAKPVEKCMYNDLSKSESHLYSID